MSGFIFKIDSLENSAFADNYLVEVARILKAVANDIENGREEGSIRDINGNKVGQWNIEPPEAEQVRERESH